MSTSNNKVRRPELLAPAGGFEQLKYAIHFGADAVYIATDKFGLRQRAENFTLETMPVAVSQAHAAGVQVFVTCNAYLHDRDTAELPRYLEALDAAGVDAVIVSDLGALRLAKKYAPHVAIHISTQASCSNVEAALTYYELGARRIVCARELSLAEIAEMKQQIPDDLEIEVFAHGAMCMSISGRCLLSDYLTGRSANQGHCSQPCRWGYTLHEQDPAFVLEEETRPGLFYPVEQDERGSYIMSSSDMNMLDHVSELRDAGIDSLKIEGRNKKAFYVATVVNAYRQVLDGADPKDFTHELEVVSHRPYSTGFFFGPATQAVDQKGYIQYGDWVGEVQSSDPIEDDQWEVLFACRNRLSYGDVVEILSPGEPVRQLTIRNLCRVYADGTHEKVKCANVSMETYSFESDIPLKKDDMIRSIRKDPSRKN